ncbi:MAG TPA: GNAT family N-acetyltransferase [Xanthobacteraceae bacterium]|jgi:GNAT superfamily N-acetyltransferase|nr:GNAT family N-acetyltransferase [Xanthobacteraceae bacterium]
MSSSDRLSGSPQELESLEFRHAESEAELRACFPVIRELRPNLSDETAFLAQVRRQAAEGYRVMVGRVAGEIVSYAGYRLGESLSRGRFLYVDDLVTAACMRSRGCGRRMLGALAAEARRAGCATLVLDSGFARAGAHRFYVRHGFDIQALHFRMKLGD